MIDRISTRRDRLRLARRGVRFRRTALWCTWCPRSQSSSTDVAFALPRALGPAVSRNRLRRRLRELLRAADQARPLPPGLLLVGANPGAVELTFDQLRIELDELLRQIRAPRR